MFHNYHCVSCFRQKDAYAYMVESRASQAISPQEGKSSNPRQSLATEDQPTPKPTPKRSPPDSTSHRLRKKLQQGESPPISESHPSRKQPTKEESSSPPLYAFGTGALHVPSLPDWFCGHCRKGPMNARFSKFCNFCGRSRDAFHDRSHSYIPPPRDDTSYTPTLMDDDQSAQIKRKENHDQPSRSSIRAASPTYLQNPRAY